MSNLKLSSNLGTNMKLSSNLKMAGIILAIIFVVYNIAVFSICGFTGHGGAFWSSYIFMILALISITGFGYVLMGQDIEPRDWLLGYPFYKHCTIYAIVEFICSILFMALDYKNFSSAAAFTIQIILFAIFVILMLSCFIAKNNIEEVQTKVKTNTAFMKMLLADAQSITEKIEDSELKGAFSELCDKIRFSDPVSCDQLAELEENIASKIDAAEAFIACNDLSSAKECCQKAMLLLSERNRKCKLLK